MKKKQLSTIKEILKDAKKGKIFILVDDKNRENEGDLVVPASKCNSKKVNFMAKHGRGLICLALTSNKVKKLSDTGFITIDFFLHKEQLHLYRSS